MTNLGKARRNAGYDNRVRPASVPNGSHVNCVTISQITNREDRPWGSYMVVDRGPTHQVKRIVVSPGMRLSYQVHGRRSEHWFVVQGSGKVTLDGVRTDVMLGVAIDVPIGVAHRIENLGTGDLVFIEVQHGDYFGEDDIVRLEDDFGRATAAPAKQA